MRRDLITYTFALLSLVAITACSKPAEIIGIDNPEKPASSVLDAKHHEIFIAASRQACDCEGELYSVYDINSVLAARPLLEETKGLLTLTNASGFDIFAHSMGTLLVVDVLVQSDLQSTLGDSGKLTNVMLAAPDIDIDVFRSQLGQIKQNPGNIYVFVSEDDRALSLSRKIAGGVDRLGDASTDELSGLGITVIDLSNVDVFESRAHSKYAGAPEVIQLIGSSLKANGYNDHQAATIFVTPSQILSKISGVLGQ